MPISWLHHKPHAIAVYASWPALPSAHATLATGRPATALPGPVFHRLDCTSFCWRLRKSRLAKIDSPQGMIVAYATQSGHTSEDGDGRNSPYTAAFVKNIEAQTEIGTIFRRISAEVYETTRQTQLPELSLSLIGEFYLNGKVEVKIKPDSPGARSDSAHLHCWVGRRRVEGACCVRCTRSGGAGATSERA